MEESQYNWLVGSMKDISSQTALLFMAEGAETAWYGEGALPASTSQEQDMETPEHILKTVFGYDSFRPLQRQIIQNVLDGRDTLAVLPTGAGKSLCYQIPALMLPGLTVVVSPLIALMQDQVAQLESLGLPAALLNSSLDRDAYRATCDQIRGGTVKLLYVSPEALATPRLQDLLHAEQVSVSCLTIDEAHCISEWGHDFRPDYRELAVVREQFPHAVCLALTATATGHVQSDIVRSLRMETPAVLVASFNRPNIFLEVKKKSDPLTQVMLFLRGHQDESGIIYCFSRRQVDELCTALTAHGFAVRGYHAGLSDEERAQHQKDFLQDRASVMVATVAFGMGINKPDVRFVIHYDLPKSIEQYYQEIGRAGRDGLPASALLLYGAGDKRKLQYFFSDADDPQKAERLLQGMIQYAEAKTCRRHFLLAYFGERYNPYDAAAVPQEQCCDVCRRGPLPKKDMTVPAQKYLSCVIRTRQQFGASYVIDVLTGSRSKRIVSNGDTSLSTWGIGKDMSKQDWLEINSCLIDEGYLAKSGQYNVLSVTERGRTALRERQEILLPVDFSAPAPAGTGVAFAKPKRVPTLAADDEEGNRIAQDLRAWRRRTADEMNVPPYIVFGDRTLFDIASRKPQTVAALRDCSGMGAAKTERFGESILRIVRGE